MMFINSAATAVDYDDKWHIYPVARRRAVNPFIRVRGAVVLPLKFSHLGQWVKVDTIPRSRYMVNGKVFLK